MNNERYNQIMEEVYDRYFDTIRDDAMDWLDEKQFIEKCKTNTEFASFWGLKIKERELSLDERNFSLGNDRAYKKIFGFNQKYDLEYKEKFDLEKRPTKLITITYNNETIEYYE